MSISNELINNRISSSVCHIRKSSSQIYICRFNSLHQYFWETV